MVIIMDALEKEYFDEIKDEIEELEKKLNKLLEHFEISLDSDEDNEDEDYEDGDEYDDDDEEEEPKPVSTNNASEILRR